VLNSVLIITNLLTKTPLGVKTSPIDDKTILVEVYIHQILHRATNGKVKFALQELPQPSPQGFSHKVIFNLDSIKRDS
jgi:hypothetical protein